MKKTERAAFSEFLMDEATKYRRSIEKAEVEVWFETFERVTLEDFKAAWIEHKRDDKLGAAFPKIPWMQKRLRTTGDGQAQRDWRCVEEVGGRRCGFPGSISAGHGAQCSAHYRLAGSGYSEAASLQIIEQSRDYVPPKTVMELMERGARLREEAGRRWREAHPELYQSRPTVRREDALMAKAKVPTRPEPEAPAVDFDEANIAAALAAQEAE